MQYAESNGRRCLHRSREESLHVMAGLVPAIHVLAARRKTWMPGTSPGMTAECVEMSKNPCGNRDKPYPSSSSLASTPFTALAQPLSFPSRVGWLMLGLKRCSRRQLSANLAG